MALFFIQYFDVIIIRPKNCTMITEVNFLPSRYDTTKYIGIIKLTKLQRK